MDVVLNLNLEDGTGSFQSAWQAGNMDGYTRVFLANLTSEGTGVAYFGFGNELGVTDTTAEWPGRIRGMFCDWYGSPKNDTGLVPRVQKQELVRNETNGNWEAATSNIRFAPRANCDYNGLLSGSPISNGYGAFLPFWTSADNSVVFANDNTANNPVTNNLVPTGDIMVGLEPTRLLTQEFDF